MSAEGKHTATPPWVSRRQQIYDGEGNHIARTFNDAPEGKRAQLIVSAVNAHEGLIEALLDALSAVEDAVGDDFCEEMDWEAANGELSGNAKTMQEKLSLAYRICHSWNTRHCCFYIHKNWRKLVTPTSGERGPGGHRT
jgi:hypothetical protein